MTTYELSEFTFYAKSFDHKLMATSDWRGRGIQNDGDNERGGKRDTNVTRIITLLKVGSTVYGLSTTELLGERP